MAVLSCPQSTQVPEETCHSVPWGSWGWPHTQSMGGAAAGAPSAHFSPQTFRGPGVQQCFKIPKTPVLQQGIISDGKKRILSWKSRCLIALNTALICSKYEVGHNGFSNGGKQFRRTCVLCSQPPSRAPASGICLHRR